MNFLGLLMALSSFGFAGRRVIIVIGRWSLVRIRGDRTRRGQANGCKGPVTDAGVIPKDCTSRNAGRHKGKGK